MIVFLSHRVDDRVVEWYVQMFCNLYVGVVHVYSPSVIFVFYGHICVTAEPMAFLRRVSLLFVDVALGIDDALPLLQTESVKHRQDQ